MKNPIATLIAIAGLSLAQIAHAANVAPLGLEVGVATLDQVKTRLAAAHLEQIGVNAYSDGPMFKGNPEGLDIEGLQEILIIFDDRNRLAGMVMTMADSRFDEVFQFLSGKYRLKVKEIPFVGDRYARFTQGNSLVDLSDPHLSFAMEVRYLSNAFEAAFKTRSAERDKQRRKAQSGKF